MTTLTIIVLALVLAFIPSLLYTLLVLWLDRNEREPVRLMMTVFLWGAVPAIALSILLELWLGKPFSEVEPMLLHDMATTSLVAPAVEELAKGLALLVLFLLARREFDNVLDGVVYGAIIGFGFAMTENALYFIELLNRGQAITERFGSVVFLRSLLFGLNHAFYTAIMGAGFGLAAEATGKARQWRWVFPVLGILLAIAFHAMHNLGIALAAATQQSLALAIVIVVNWGGVFLLLTIVLLARQEEQRWISAELWPEVGATLTLADFEAVRSYGRRFTLWLEAWQQGGWRSAWRSSRQHRLLTKLACLKHRQHVQGDSPQLSAEIDRVRGSLQAWHDV